MIQLGVHIEALVIVTGLADDHAGVREALAAAAKLVMGPAAMVLEPSVPPAMGFELVLAMPEPVSPAALAQLRQALEFELYRREVMHADLSVELLDETET